METLSSRVVRRFLADAITNVKVALPEFRRYMEDFFKEESQIKPVREWLAEGLRAGRVRDDYALTISQDAMDSRVLYYFRRFADAGKVLFLTILQQYNLPPATRRIIERGLKWFSKKGQKPALPSRRIERALAVVDLYEKQCHEYHDFLDAAEAAVAKGVSHEEASKGDPAAKVKAGPFTCINTGGFKLEQMQEVAKTVAEAAKMIEHSGLGKVNYGDVLVSKQIRSSANVMAFYMLTSDEFFVRGQISRKSAEVHTVIHELGHRYQFKFLQGKTKQINDLYRLISGKHFEESRKMVPKPGELLETAKGEKYVVKEFRGGTVWMTPVLTPEELQKAAEGNVNKVLKDHPEMIPHRALILDKALQTVREYASKSLSKISLEGYLGLKGDLHAKSPDYKGFVTNYAKTDATENFAEMFAFYCLGDLPPSQAVLFEELVFGDGGGNLDEDIFGR